MPRFDVEVTFPTKAKAVITTDAPDKRQAEIAVLALVKSHPPDEYDWQVSRPADPKYHAVATQASNGRRASRGRVVTEETIIRNPTGIWFVGDREDGMYGPFNSKEAAIADFVAINGRTPRLVGRAVKAPERKRPGRRKSATLVSSTNSTVAERKIRTAAAMRFGRGRTRLEFEHGQWFAFVTTEDGDEVYSVVDAWPGVGQTGIDFEAI